MQGKMSDEFKLPLHWPDDGTVGSVLDADFNMQFQSQEQLNLTTSGRNLKRQSMARAAAHAINCHDDFVDELELLRSELESLGMMTPARRIKKLLNKARGEK